MKTLTKTNNPKVRQELIDADYLKQLSPEDLKWYAAFTDEYVNAAIKKTKAGKVKAGYLHNTTELAKERYDANNHRNNDVYSVTKVNNLLGTIEQSFDEESFHVHNAELTEDASIAIIDSEEDKHLSLEEFLEVEKILLPEVRDFYRKYYNLK